MSVSGFSDAPADWSVGPTSVREDTIRMLPRRIGDRRRHDFVQPVCRKTKGQLARTICAQPDGTDRVWVAVSPVIEYKIDSPSIARPASKDFASELLEHESFARTEISSCTWFKLFNKCALVKFALSVAA